MYSFNIILLILGVLTAVSSILLEIIGNNAFIGIEFRTWVWTHIIVCLLCMSAVIYHLYIHWGGLGNWLKRVRKLNAKATKWLSWLSFITFISGIIVAVIFIIGAEHNPLGGIHGKFGLIVIAISVFHIHKRFGWFHNRKNGKAFMPNVDNEKCIKCAKCVKRCPAQVFVIQNKQVKATNALFCHQCMKCVKNCPSQAIV